MRSQTFFSVVSSILWAKKPARGELHPKEVTDEPLGVTVFTALSTPGGGTTGDLVGWVVVGIDVGRCVGCADGKDVGVDVGVWVG